MIRGLLRTFGLVPHAELAAAQEKLARLRDKVDAMQRRAAEADAAASDQKRAHETALQQLNQQLTERDERHRQQIAREQEAARKALEQVAGLRDELQDRDARLEAVAAEATALEAKVTASLQDLDRTRERLMMLEMKLDLLESAANMLDRRLRGTSPLSNASG